MERDDESFFSVARACPVPQERAPGKTAPSKAPPFVTAPALQRTASRVTLRSETLASYSAACCATVGALPATVARRMSRGCDWS
jgi:hypothetical protein